MIRKNNLSLLLIIIIIQLFSLPSFAGSKEGDMLLQAWRLKSSLLITESGENISVGNFKEDGWYPVTVPSTVLSALVKNGVYPDPRIDMNNYKIPDVSDSFNIKNDLAKYSYLPGGQNPFKDPYWFRTEFVIPDSQKGKTVWLNFKGINYRAEVWLNGNKIASSNEMAGMFQRFKFNVTDYIKNEGQNYLAVKIFQVDNPGTPGTQKEVFGETRNHAEDIFKDVTLKISGGWDCALPVRDRNMGIYEDVYLSFTGAVDIINPYIVTDLPLPDTTTADIKISAELVNTTNSIISVTLKGKIDLIREFDFISYTKKFTNKFESVVFEKKVDVPAKGTMTVKFSEEEFPQLKIKNPLLWRPNGYGEQYLHNLELTAITDNKISAQKNTSFGIRKITNTIKELNGENGRVFYVNGQRVFCRGGWIQPDLLLDMDTKRIYDEARLLANANVNMIANEDMPSPKEEFMDACDKYGLMLWQVFYQCWTAVPGTPTAYFPLDHYLAIKNANDIILRYRNNASLVLWCAAVESTVCPDLYMALKSSLKNYDTTRPFLTTSGVLWDLNLTPYVNNDLPVGLSDDGEPQWHWRPEPTYFDVIRSVKFQMFRSELGQPAAPVLSTIKKFIKNAGQDKNNKFFPLDSVWAEHGAWDSDDFAYKGYHEVISKRYGACSTIEDYARKAQYINADGYRVMYEAANHRMWDITSGVMLWKLNDCAPSILWQIYDWYLNPNAAYYYAKKACEPLHIQMNANDGMVSVINRLHKELKNIVVEAKLYDYNLKLKWEKSKTANVGEDRYFETFEIPKLNDLTTVYFVKLELKDEKGKTLSSNFYWLSSKNPSEMSELANAENPKLKVKYKIEESENEYVIKVKLKNASDKLSFFNRLAVVKKEKNEEVLPTFWEDNFITLFPGEERNITARLAKSDAENETLTVTVNDND